MKTQRMKAKRMKTQRFLLAICILLSMAAGMVGCGKGAGESKVQITCSIKKDMEFGSTQFIVAPEEFINAGFEFGDSCKVEFSNGQCFENVPFYNGYYGKTGELAIVAYPGYEFNVFARCQGNSSWDEFELSDGDMATITLIQKDKFDDTQDALSMVYSDDREHYSSDAVFANFRAMSGGNLKPDMFYRGASPFDNQYNRASFINEFIEEYGIKYVLDLADTEEKIAGYSEKEDFKSDYAASLYDNGDVYLAGLSASYRSDNYVTKTVAMLKEMINHQGPFYIHCTEGKDRTGFICMLLECIGGCSYDELKYDYMETYFNYYGILESSDPEKYRSVVEVKFNDMIFWLAGVDKEEDATVDKLKQGAHDYLINGGMSEEEYLALVELLCVE